jgi:hypothetical protein
VDDFRQLIDLDQATSDDTLRLARTAAEAIRGVNHASRQEAGLGQPSVTYDVIGALALALAASRLGQVFTQITCCCSPGVVYHWIQTGQLAARRSGNRLCIPWTSATQADCRTRITSSGHLNPAARRTRPRQRH